MCVQGVRTFINSASTSPRRFGRAWPDRPDVGGQHRFTNTTAPRFDGTGCWQQHLLVFRAIVKSNGWSQDMSAYYDTPGRMAVILRQFENARRRPGLDPATFAKELGILALRGFADMKEKVRDLMIRNKFIAAQRNCDMRRHLDAGGERTTSEGDALGPRIRRTVAQMEGMGLWRPSLDPLRLH